MLAPWVMDEMQTADLDDKRLDVRLKAVLSALWQHPTASIPAACGGRTEMVAAFFFENEKATFADSAAHSDATRQRIAAQRVVVLAQDTTEIDLTRPAQQVFGGVRSMENPAGAFLHPLVPSRRTVRRWEPCMRPPGRVRKERAAHRSHALSGGHSD